MLAMNAVGTHYTKKEVPAVKVKVPEDAPRQTVGQPYTGRDDDHVPDRLCPRGGIPGGLQGLVSGE